jgi:hypothetical protein
VLSFELSTSKFSYSQSRTFSRTTAGTSSCSTSAGANLAQITIGELSNYSCNFVGTRLEYSALEITTPAGFSSQQRKRWLREQARLARRRARRMGRRL